MRHNCGGDRNPRQGCWLLPVFSSSLKSRIRAEGVPYESLRSHKASSLHAAHTCATLCFRSFSRPHRPLTEGEQRCVCHLLVAPLSSMVKRQSRNSPSWALRAAEKEELLAMRWPLSEGLLVYEVSPRATGELLHPKRSPLPPSRGRYDFERPEK